ncbi:MAG TPA: LysR family transcriptional regulator, partial [Ramlibacter sp.]|nr:LysR family transcriptional regulator [Ramlibacter sp.]
RLAADSLALTHGAVSRRITKLADDIGVQLFQKSGRGLRLTPAGETLNLTLGRFFGELASTVQSLRATRAAKSALVLSCEPSVAARWLIPRLGGFQAAHPNIAVHLSVGGGLVDFRKNQVDLAIRRLDFAVPGTWNVRPLFAERVGPVMRQELVSKFERGDYLALGSKTRPDAWAQWLKTHPSARRPTEIRYYDHHSLIVEAAAAGLGVALSPLVLVVDDVERGTVAAPAGFDPDGSQYGLIWLGSNELEGVAQELAEWLQTQFGCVGLNVRV